MELVMKVGGWKRTKIGYVLFYRCPECAKCQEMILRDANGQAECFACDKKFPHDSFVQVRLRRKIVVCSRCSADVPLTPSYFGVVGLGYICSECHSYVAVAYGMQAVNPTTVLKPNWNPIVWKRCEVVDKNTAFTVCRTRRDYLVVQLLQAMVKEEDSRFLFVREKDQLAGLYVDIARRKYLGFLVWNVADAHAVLRQVFIVPGERRRGLALRLVDFWVARYADKVNTTFGIESPNEKALNLHIKLGHIVQEGDSVRGVKCFFVQGL